MKLLSGFIIILICTLLLNGCGWSGNYSFTNPPAGQKKPKTLNLSDKELKKLSARELCGFWFQNDDPRLTQALNTKGASCDEISLQCSEEGFKRNSKEFNSCFARHEKDLKFASKKMSNPAFGYCHDSGFKEGTQAMATCIASWQEREQVNQMIKAQQQANDRARMDRAWQNTFDNIKNSPKPTYTNCHSLGNSINCTTY